MFRSLLKLVTFELNAGVIAPPACLSHSAPSCCEMTKFRSEKSPLLDVQIAILSWLANLAFT